VPAALAGRICRRRQEVLAPYSPARKRGRHSTQTPEHSWSCRSHSAGKRQVALSAHLSSAACCVGGWAGCGAQRVECSSCWARPCLVAPPVDVPVCACRLQTDGTWETEAVTTNAIAGDGNMMQACTLLLVGSALRAFIDSATPTRRACS
jgi:hypothetical protein